MTADTVDAATLFQTEFADHMAVVTKTASRLGPAFTTLVQVCSAALYDGHKLLLFGNGGSAADAQHLATELVVRYRRDRPAIPAMALTTDTSALTAIGNDLGFEQLFARQVEALAGAGDVVIGISTSGNSRNVLLALEAARRRGCRTVGLTGAGGGRLCEVVELLLAVPSETTARIQEMHILIGHALCDALERRWDGHVV